MKKNTKKTTEKYLVIDEEDQSIELWCDSYKDAERDAISFGRDNIVILKIAAAWRVYLPEEPELEVKPMDLGEL